MLVYDVSVSRLLCQTYLAHDVSVICGRQLIVLGVVVHHLRTLQRGHALCDQLIDTFLPGPIPFPSHVVMRRILLNTLVEERTVQPLSCIYHVGDSAECNLGVEVLREGAVQAALEHTLSLSESLVLGFKLLFAHDYGDALFVELWTALYKRRWVNL